MTRKYGSGALYQRQSDGRWIARLPTGRGSYQYATGTDEDSVRRRLDEMRRERDRTTPASRPRGGERLRELAERYMTTVAPVLLRPNTLAGHHTRMRDHVLPVIGGIRVAQLDVGDVQRCVSRMQATGLSPKSIENTIGVLSSILQHAVRERTLTVNVARLATLPPVVSEPLPKLSTDELRRFLEVTRGEPLWPVFVLLGTTGMRVSEVTGLLWRDCVTERGEVVLGAGLEPATRAASTRSSTSELPQQSGRAETVYVAVKVTGQYRRERDGDDIVWRREEPKTPKSRRTVYLPALAREAMAVARQQARSTHKVFTGRNPAAPMDRNQVNHTFHRALEQHGFPDVRLHSLRSSAIIAVLDANGGDLRDAMHMAGHSSITTTINDYGQEADEARKRSAVAMDRALGKIVGK